MDVLNEWVSYSTCLRTCPLALKYWTGAQTVACPGGLGDKGARSKVNGAVSPIGLAHPQPDYQMQPTKRPRPGPTPTLHNTLQGDRVGE